jgi:hypothetical protein
VRAPGTILSIAALSWGFLQAPFFHIHAEELEHRTTSPAHLHLHLAPTEAGQTIAAHTADEDSIEVEWGIALPSALAFVFELAICDAIVIMASQIISAEVLIPKPRSHDPPDLTPRHPRPPPA